MQTHFPSDKTVMTFSSFFWRPPCPRGRIRQLLVAESQCSGPCNSLRRLHVVRAPLTLYRAWTWWPPKKKVITLLSDGKCVCTICQRLFSPQRLHSNFRFSLVQINLDLNLFENQTILISNFLFENRIVQTSRRSKTDV